MCFLNNETGLKLGFCSVNPFFFFFALLRLNLYLLCDMFPVVLISSSEFLCDCHCSLRQETITSSSKGQNKGFRGCEGVSETVCRCSSSCTVLWNQSSHLTWCRVSALLPAFPAADPLRPRVDFQKPQLWDDTDAFTARTNDLATP